MKKLCLVAAVLSAVLWSANVQSQCDYDYQKRPNFLKEYEAPTFSLSRLDVRLGADGNSEFSQFGQNGSYGSDVRVDYGFYQNSPFYQGSVFSSVNNRFQYAYNDASETQALFNINDVRVNSNNYFFLNNRKSFFGIHGNVANGFSFANVNDESARNNLLDGNLALGYGFGRIEPIQYARNAMDIERQLQCNDRLNASFTDDELKALSDQIAQTNNVRFYDFRLRRIQQYRELDAVLKRIGKTTDEDIVYFAALADAYLYARYFPRSSGMRNEWGVSGGLTSRTNDFDTNTNYHEMRYLGYYKFDWFIPQNYVVQHNINAIIAGGLHEYELESYAASSDFLTQLIAGYELALYPTTRTNFNFGVRGFVGLENEEMSYAGQLYSDGAIYLSPKFRVNYSAGINYSTGMPRSARIEHLYQNPFFEMGIEGIRFQFRAGLTYAIF